MVSMRGGGGRGVEAGAGGGGRGGGCRMWVDGCGFGGAGEMGASPDPHRTRQAPTGIRRSSVEVVRRPMPADSPSPANASRAHTLAHYSAWPPPPKTGDRGITSLVLIDRVLLVSSRRLLH